MIYLKTAKIYRATKYAGIGYFCNAFLFYALGFLAIYSQEWYTLLTDSPIAVYITIPMEYFLMMGGFYLVYSLLWKNFEDIKEKIHLDRMVMMHIVAVIVALLDFFWTQEYLMFSVEIIVGLYAVFTIYNNYSRDMKNKYQQFYLISMVCNVIAWAMYFMTMITRNAYPMMMAYTYVVVFLTFMLLLYTVLRVTSQNA